MTQTSAQYRDLAERLAAVADDAEPSRWDDPSPCDGWSAADVIGHIVGTQRDLLAEHGIEVGPPADVPGDPAKAWWAHAEHIGALLANPAVADATFDGFFGPTTIGETITRFYGFDMIVHRWDVARAVGVETTFSTEELDVIEASIDGFGEHLYAEGICKPAVDVDPSATRQDRLLARMGRDPCP